MNKKIAVLATEDDLLVDLTLNNVPASLLTEFVEKIVRPYYNGNLNAAVQDLLHKALVEQEFVHSRITHIRTVETQQMGKTFPTYRMALEFEIQRWKGFKKALHDKEDQEAFEELMDLCRNNAMASSNACNPIIFEPMTMSILIAQQKKLQALDYQLNEVIWQEICSRYKPKAEKQTINSASQPLNVERL